MSSVEFSTYQGLRKLTRQKPELKVMSIHELLEHEFQAREVILSPWLITQGLSMIYAPRGIGKTHVSLGIAYAVASGGTFLGWQAEKPRGVLFIDGEMPGYALKERIANMHTADTEVAAPLHFITPDVQIFGIPDLSTQAGQQLIEQHITDDIELIILDNLSTLVRSGRENEAESWQPIQTWALSLRARGKSVLFIHHSGKGGQQRGTSRREDVLDTVISLNRPADYTAEKGACFEVKFEKARYIHGDDVQSFEAQLITNQQGQQVWRTSKLEDSNFQKVTNLLNEGWCQQDIAEKLKLNKGTVSRYAKRARDFRLTQAVRG